MKCNIDGDIVDCKVTENMGYQDGFYVKAVEYKGEEYIVCKYGTKWRTRTTKEIVAPLIAGLIKQGVIQIKKATEEE